MKRGVVSGIPDFRLLHRLSDLSNSEYFQSVVVTVLGAPIYDGGRLGSAGHSMQVIPVAGVDLLEKYVIEIGSVVILSIFII